jgi:hypothetical protein
MGNEIPVRRWPGGFDIVNEGSSRARKRLPGQALIKDIIVWQIIQSACVARRLLRTIRRTDPRMSFAENDQATKGF